MRTCLAEKPVQWTVRMEIAGWEVIFADVPIARTCFERTPITTPNVYKVRSPMTVYSARRGVVPRRRKMNSLGLKLRGVTGFGQTNGKNGSHIHLAFYFEFCVMILHNSFANGKAYPCA